MGAKPRSTKESDNAMSAAMTGELPREGTLDATPGIHLVRTLLTGGHTGRLIAQRDSQKKALYVAAGRPVGAKSNQIQETLTRLAMRFQLINEETYNTILEAVNSGSGRLQGELMVDHGVPQDKVEALLQRQCALRFADVCTWQQGRFEWIPELPDSFPECRINPLNVFIEYVRQRHTPETLERAAEQLATARVRRHDDLFFRYDREFSDLPGTREVAAQLLEASGRPVSELIPAERNARLRWLVGLYALLEFGALQLDQVESAPSPAPHPAPIETSEVVRPPEGLRDPELEAKIEELRERNAFEILDVPLEADARTVKRAYFKLAKQYHPDRYFDHESRQPNRSAEALFALIGRAYDELRDDDRRAIYRDYIERGTTEEEEMARAANILQSEVEFQKGVLLLRHKQRDEARRHLLRAVELHPDEVEYRIYLAWCRFLDSWDGDKEEAEAQSRELKTVLKQLPKHIDGHFYFGRMLKIMGKHREALEVFRHVLKLHPRHPEAPKEIRAIEMALQAP